MIRSIAVTDYSTLFSLRGRRALLIGAGGIGREAGLAVLVMVAG